MAATEMSFGPKGDFAGWKDGQTDGQTDGRMNGWTMGLRELDKPY